MPWIDTLDNDTRAAAAAKGWDRLDGDAAAQAIFKSYRNLESTRPAQDTILSLRNPTEYSFDGVKVGNADASPEFISHVRQLATDLKLPPVVARDLATRLAAQLDSDTAAATAKATEAVTQSTERLKTTWGDKYEANTAVAANAFDALKLPKVNVDALIATLGVDKVMDMGFSLGSRMGEAKLLSGGSVTQTTTMTREQALTERNRLTSDPAFGAKLMAGDAEAKQTLENVSRAILGDPNGQWSPPPENFGRTKENPNGEFAAPKVA